MKKNQTSTWRSSRPSRLGENLVQRTPCLTTLEWSGKYSVVILLILFVAAVPVFSQTAEEIDHLLTLDTVNYGQAAWLILNAAGVLDKTEPSQAFIYAKEKNWLPGNAGIDNNARLDGTSLLIMNAWELKGGIMYSITKSARYAYRELVYINVIQGRFSSRTAVTPDQLLYMVNFILAREENNE